MLRSGIEQLSRFVEDYPELDCDGATRLIHVALYDAGVNFKLMQGYVEHIPTSEIVQPHFWIVVGKFIVDYKLRKWLGPQAPNGVFMPREFEDYEYAGAEMQASLDTSRLLYQVVTGKQSVTWCLAEEQVQ